MKKFLGILCSFILLISIGTGCADMAGDWAVSEVNNEMELLYPSLIAENVSLMEDGYYIIEGFFWKIEKSGLFLKTEEGQILYFKLLPETIIYAGEDNEISEGQNIRVVFDGKMNGTEMEEISVIAVTAVDEGI